MRAITFVTAALAVDVASAASYYTPTYVGRDRDVDSSWDGGRKLVDRTTGVAYDVDSGAIALDAPGSAALDLPKTTILRGGMYPFVETFAMRGYWINPNTGTVVGMIPSGASQALPWSSVFTGYATRDEDGTYSDFQRLTNGVGADATILLNSADQVLIRTVTWGSSGADIETRLIDAATGIATSLRDLIDPEFWGRYGRLDVEGLTARGDILVSAIPSGDYGTPDSSLAEIFILTPPGVAAPTPIPEPSLLWLAAGSIALGLRARRRGRRDRSPA
ncbi:MAG: hypothetical protein BGO49_13040 [Planctomycetales bacterium 71-10]|nr:MAG: hypothetical protein BGO49_13040 [Planctomycetales bacterium 71-10]